MPSPISVDPGSVDPGSVGPRPVDPTPHAHFPKQAVVVIHGIGEQIPMDTIKSFVRAAWETDAEVSHNGMPDPAEVFSKPDLRTGSLELRRITTRQSTKSDNFPNGVRSDFYELYWADLSSGSTLGAIETWAKGLLLRNPFTQVPPGLHLAWLLLVILSAAMLYLAGAGLVEPEVALFGVKPYGWLDNAPGWVGPALAVLLGFVTNKLVVPYAGRVVRYTRATPENIAARKDIRERGLALLTALHDGTYERIILVGHSLGTIMGYDLLSYFWASRPAAYSVSEGDGAEFALFQAVEKAAHDCALHPTHAHIEAFHNAQRALSQALRRRPAPAKGEPDRRWLITDFITLGSPLTHAGILLASDEASLLERIGQRQYPASPPVREILDPKNIDRARDAGFVVDEKAPCLMAFPLDQSFWQLHHAAPFAVVHWTNIYDPARLVFMGDVISGPLAPHFGKAIVDINLRKLRGASFGFTHTKYWDLNKNGKATVAVKVLRKALNLAGDKPPV